MVVGLPSLLRLPPRYRRGARRRRMATLLCLAAVCLLLVLPLYAVYKPPGLLFRYFERRWPDVLWRVSLPGPKPGAGGGKGDQKVVALTIDDAPSEYTRDILELLRENDARATFFVIGGQVSGREPVLQDIVREGHELGNHGMHDEAARALSTGELEEQIIAVDGMLRHAYTAVAAAAAGEDTAGGGKTGPPFNYFRPGSGFFSDAMRALVSRLGYRLVLGSIYPHDAQIGSPWLNARHILSMTRPGGIIICHDRRSWTVPMLREVLPELRRRGYRVVTVTELLREADA